MTSGYLVQGSENKFLLLDQTKLKHPLNKEELVNLTKSLNNNPSIPHKLDGILVVDQSTNKEALGKMQVFNADGSEASMCGNGLRTVSRYLAEKFNKTKFKVETKQANLSVLKEKNLAPNVPAYSVEIGPISFAASTFPFYKLGSDTVINKNVPALSSKLNFTAISVPNPHLISFVDKKELASSQLGKLGKKLNGKNPYFPEGVNISFANVINDHTLFVKTFERGVGFTNACGTGMSATTLAFTLINYPKENINKTFTVLNPGGMVKTKVIKDKDKQQSKLQLIGNATFEYEVNLDENELHQGQLNNIKLIDTKEENSYKQFIKQLTP